MKAKIKYISSIIALGFILLSTIQAQTGSVTGTVYDENGDPFPGINVTLVEAEMSSTTNLQGMYSFTGIPGPCDQILTLQVSLLGYFGTTVQYYDRCLWLTPTVDIHLVTDRAPLMVTNTDDSGPGTLRQAIEDANTNLGKDYIHFDVIDLWMATIQPLSPLPAITDEVVINGFSQPRSKQNTNPAGTGFNTGLQVVLDGSLTGAGAAGLNVIGQNCEIAGLVIQGFDNIGIAIANDNNLVRECFIGTDSLGYLYQPNYGNGYTGIRINGADLNEVTNCVVSANGAAELSPNILITGGSSQNLIYGNLIGTDIAGTYPTLNPATGININESPGNTIGGLTDAERNIIFGGVHLLGVATTGNNILGNYIGPDVSGQNALGAGSAVRITNGSNGNEIGPDNVISGNPINAVSITGNTTQNNTVFGNYIGVAADGNTPMPNGSTNVYIVNSPDNQIGGLSADSANVISGCPGNGILISGPTATGNMVVGNMIGTNFDGTIAVPNESDGILIAGAAHDNTIRGGNLISGNGASGILIDNNSENTRVLNNLIGVNASNNGLIANQNYGVVIFASPSNTIEGNTICGSGRSGISLFGNGCMLNTISQNYIGTNQSSLPSLGNSWEGIRIFQEAERNIIDNNIISGNQSHGIFIYESTPDSIVITANKIGTSVDGMSELSNGNDGIYIEGGTNTTIGGVSGKGNLISGNHTGINIMTSAAHHTTILGNLIGTNADGTAAIPNGEGIRLQDPHDITIGGNGEGTRNIISGNTGPGIWIFGPVTNSIVSNNYIGTDITGELPLPNNIGIRMELGAENNYIGAGANGPGNLIAYNTTNGISLDSDQNFVLGNVIQGNGEYGIIINGSQNTIGGPTDEDKNYLYGHYIGGLRVNHDGHDNLIEGNYFGTDHEGRLDLTEAGYGIMVLGSSDNTVKNNLISGYRQYGIHITRSDPYTDANRNWIEGNTIGLNASGDGYIPNGHGIVIDSAANNTVFRNVVAGNTGNGIVVFDWQSRAVNNHISQNSIFDNGELGIDLLAVAWGVTENDIPPLDPDTGSNNLQNFPNLDSISFAEGKVTLGGYLRTKSDSTYIIEFFSSGVADDTGYGEGEFYLGCDTVITNDTGYVYFVTTLPIQGYGAQVITATATDLDGNTSEFSQVIGSEKDQVVNMPFRYTMNSEGLSTVSLADYQNAIRSSFQTWDNVPTADIQMVEAESSDEKYANATDGLNLISFQDDRFPFATGVLAVTAKTLRMTSGGTVAEILDADIIFNPAYINDPVRPFAVLEEGDTETVAFDIQSICTHEIGHALGMIHSGVYSSTMFFMLGYGTTERELDMDDKAWASYRYQGTDFAQSHGMISGRVTYGDLGDVNDPSTHPPVAGALVLAIDTDTNEQFHAYTDANGNYTVPIPMESETMDEFWIHIQPLDGDVYGTALKPANISPYIYSHTMYTDFPEEFYDDQESYDDDPGAGDPILVASESTTSGIDLITNKDLTPPTVIGTSLDEESVDLAVSPTIAIKFSEPVDIYSFDETTCFLERTVDTVGGEYTLLADSTHIVLLKPVEALQYSSNYKLNISGITDLKGNALATPYFSSFTTQAPDTEPPSVYDVIPADSITQVDVTKPIKVFFSEPMNKPSVESGFLLMTVDSALVEGDIGWDLANKEMTYSPVYSLEEETDYLICLSTQATDLSGNAMEYDTTFTFSTVDVAIPQILYLGPGDEYTGITVETPVVVKFSEPMDQSSFTTTSFSLTGTGAVSGTFEYLDDDRTIVFRPDLPLSFDQLYTITLTNDISDMSDPNQYLANTTTTFQTATVITVPHIGYMDPPFGAVGAQTTIVGSGFDPDPLNNIVMFDGLAANVSKATLESLTVNVPYDAEDGPVTVSVNGVAADNSFEFDVIPPNTDPSYNVIASSTSGSRTRAVVINPNAGYAYVTNWGDNTVTPIDISGYIPVPGTDINVGIEPMDIDLNPAGTLAYVTNYLSNSVSVIGTKFGETGYHEVTKDIPVGYHPYGVAVSSDKKVYVANNESEYVSVIDVDPSSGGFDHVIANVKTGSKNRSIVVTPNSALILVTGEDGVNIIDRDPISPTFNDVIASASKGSSTRHITITADAALALATTDDGVILIIDIFQPRGTEFGNVIASVKTGSSARNTTISPDAMYVYITNPDENTVSVYQLDYSIIPGYGASLSNPEGLLPIATIEVADTPYAIIGHPNSEYILVTHDSDEGGVTKIGIEGLSIDPIESLNELIASVKDARQEGTIPRWLGRTLIYNLKQTLNRVNWDMPGAAILSLNKFIRKVKRNIRYGRIPEELGNAWLEAAYKIREQLIKDNNAKIGLKGTLVEGSGINSMKDSNTFNNTELIGIPTLKLENRPNPFSYQTQVYFEIPNSGQADIPVIMRVFNTNGQVVKTLVHMDMEPGRYSVIWNSNLDDGGLVSDGIYLLELMTTGQRKVITISVIK